MKKGPEEVIIAVTGDGSCSMYPIAITICTSVLANQPPFDRGSAKLNEFFKIFAEFHKNFNPTTLENFKEWVKEYAVTRRDMELLVGPVLRHWYMREKEGMTKDQSLARLVKERSQHLDDSAIEYICHKLGLNLKFTEDGFSWDSIDGNKDSSTVHVYHSEEHFDLGLNANLAKLIKPGESKILARNRQNVDNAWNAGFAPLDTLKPAAPSARDKQFMDDLELARRLQLEELDKVKQIKSDRDLAESLMDKPPTRKRPGT